MHRIRVWISILALIALTIPLFGDYYYLTGIGGVDGAVISGDPPITCEDYANIPGTWEIWCEAFGDTQSTNRQDYASGEVSAWNCTDYGWADVYANDQDPDVGIYANSYYDDPENGFPEYSDSTECSADGGCQFTDNGAPDPQPCGPDIEIE